jgi:hypothetical protein
MKDNKTIGTIFGVILGFVFVITCTSPLSSDVNETTGSGKYQISTCAAGSSFDIRETIINTETGEVVSRHKVDNDLYTKVD